MSVSVASADLRNFQAYTLERFFIRRTILTFIFVYLCCQIIRYKLDHLRPSFSHEITIIYYHYLSLLIPEGGRFWKA